jgi:hypothetical protein
MLLIGTVLMVGALTFIPALALGPVVEHLQMTGATPDRFLKPIRAEFKSLDGVQMGDHHE